MVRTIRRPVLPSPAVFRSPVTLPTLPPPPQEVFPGSSYGNAGLRPCAWCFFRGCVILQLFWANISFQKRTAMPVAVKIKASKYGSAIGLLLERGGAFQTRHERIPIVNSEQKKALEETGLVETNGLMEGPGKDNGHKKDAS